MATPWVLVAWGEQFRRELNAIAPGRDTSTDGSVGNLAHQGSPSGHNPDESGNAERRDSDSKNEVRAIDVDKDIRVPGLTAAMIVAYLVGRCRAGLERRLIYIIWDRTIWSASSGWAARQYTGSSPHTEHFHLSGDPAGDEDARPFGLASLIKEDELSDQAESEIHSVFTGFFFGGSSMGRTVDPDGAGKGKATNSVVSKLDYLLSEADKQRLRDEALIAAVRDDADRDAILTRIDQAAAALPKPPSAEENAEAMVRRLGEESPEDAAVALVAVIGPDRAALLATALAEAARAGAGELPAGT